MYDFELRVDPQSPRTAAPGIALATALAKVACDPVAVSDDVSTLVTHRFLDTVAAAVIALNRPPVVAARTAALAQVDPEGATVFGVTPTQRFHVAAAAAANATAIRDLDFNDSYFSADTAHPSDNIAALLAVAQSCGCTGKDLIRGIVTAYEIQIALVNAIPLIRLGMDQSTHLGPSIAAGISAMLSLDLTTTANAIELSAHCAATTRQGRTGQGTSWKSALPGFASQIAIQSTDRAMRGEHSPQRVYEGPQGLVARVLGGQAASWSVPLPDIGEEKRAITHTYPKQHAVGYASQAFIDLAMQMRTQIDDINNIERVDIYTSRHHHDVHGSGAADTDSMRPGASRESLDHSIMYAFTVALQDGRFHPVDSYATARSTRADTVQLWQKTQTHVDDWWNNGYENAVDPTEKLQGGRVEITFANGTKIIEQQSYPDAHPLGRQPFTLEESVAKFRTCAHERVDEDEQQRLVNLVTMLPDLDSAEVRLLNIEALELTAATEHGIFDHPARTQGMAPA